MNNTTDTPFITSDRPIINPHAEDDENPPKKLELYYPLSPSEAIFLIDSRTQRPTTANRREVEEFNALMVQNAHEQVFSNSSDYLKSLA